MTYFRRDWTTEFYTVHQELERWVGHFTSLKPPPIGFAPGGWEPAVDIYETAKEIVVQAELAGMRQEDIEIIATNSSLVLRGGRKDINPERKKHYHQMEIQWGPFERAILLPAEVRPEETKATYYEGLLEVVMPKSHAPRSIP